MLQIIINNIQLELAENSKIRILLKSPILSKNEGSYSFPIDTYLSKSNIRALGVNMQNPYDALFKDYNARLLFRSRMIECVLSISSIKGNTISFYLKFDMGVFISSTKDLTLQDLKLGTFASNGVNATNFLTFQNELINKKYPQADMVFYPVINPNFCDNTHSILENWQKNQYQLVNDWDFVNGGYGFTGLAMMTPFYYVGALIEKIFLQFGYVIGRNYILNNLDLSCLTLYSNNAISNFLFDFSSVYATQQLNNLLPNITILDFITGIEQLFNIHCIINNDRTVDIINFDDIISDNDIIKTNPLKNIEYSNKRVNGFSYTFSADSNDEYWSANIKDIYQFEKFIKEPVASVNQLPLTDEMYSIRLVTTAEAFYQIGMNYLVNPATPIWKQFAPFLQGQKKGDEYYSMNSNISPVATADRDYTISGTGELIGYNVHITDAYGQTKPVFMTLAQYSYWRIHPDEFRYTYNLNVNVTVESFPKYNISQSQSATYRVKHPIVYEKGNFGYVRDAIVDNPFRLLFYRGVQFNSPFFYPYATWDVKNYDGNKIPEANLSLCWYGEYGLYEQRWKKFLHWKINRAIPIVYYEYLNEDEIFNFNFTKKRMVDSKLCLPSEVDVELDSKQIYAAKITAETL